MSDFELEPRDEGIAVTIKSARAAKVLNNEGKPSKGGKFTVGETYLFDPMSVFGLTRSKQARHMGFKSI